MSVKFDDLNPLRSWDTKGIVRPENVPEKFRDFRETGAWAAYRLLFTSGLLVAWLALTSVKYHGNQFVSSNRPKVVPVGKQMERLTPTEIFRKERTTFKGCLLFSLWPKRPESSVPFLCTTRTSLRCEDYITKLDGHYLYPDPYGIQKCTYKWNCSFHFPFLR